MMTIFYTYDSIAGEPHEKFLKQGCDNNKRVYDSSPNYSCLEYAAILVEKKGKDSKKSKHYYEKGLNHRCDSFSYCVNDGFAYYKLGKYELAIEYTKRAIEEYPNDMEISMAYNNLGLVYKKQKLIGKAKGLFEISCEKNSYGSRYGCWNLALLSAKDRDQEMTLKYLKKALDKGYNHWKWIQVNESAKELRKIPGVEELVSKYKK